jgi:hypothetical protein
MHEIRTHYYDLIFPIILRFHSYILYFHLSSQQSIYYIVINFKVIQKLQKNAYYRT